jgi:hypothetical protein
VISLFYLVRRVMLGSPMNQVLRELRERRVRLEDLQALEVFGGHGDIHTMDYACHVASLEVWEIDPECKGSLMKNLPMAKIKITDSYQEVRTCQSKYGLIVIDNQAQSTPSAWGEDHCEHFDLFPDVFRISSDFTILILNIILKLNIIAHRRYPYLFNSRQLACRREFYATEHPESLSLPAAVGAYSRLILKNGFAPQWHFSVRRSLHTDVYYLVIAIKRG